MRHLVFAVALFTVVFLPAAPAKADGWTLNHITVTGNGDSTGQDPRMPIGPIDLGETDYPPFYLPMEVVEYNDDITSNINVQYQPVYVWSSSTGAPPPTPSIFKVTVNAEGNTDDPAGAPVAANDGFGDTSPTDTEYSVYSSGLHLIQVTPQQSGSEWTATLAPTEMSASGARYEPSAHVDFTVTPDSRAISISSSLSGTSYKPAGPDWPAPLPNVPDANGTMYADTLEISEWPFNNDITFYADTSGPWAANSSYLWHTSVGEPDSSTSGTFTIPTDPILSYEASYDSVTWNSPLPTEHAYIDCTDASDGAHGTANYYIRFHKSVENWVQDPAPVTFSYHAYTASQVVPTLNGSTDVNVGPDPVNWQLYGQVSSGVIAVGSAVVFAVTKVPVWLIGLAAAASSTLSDAAAPSPQVVGFPETLAQFNSDVTVESEFQNGTIPNGTPNSSTMDVNMMNELSSNPNLTDLLQGNYGHVYLIPRIYEKDVTTLYDGDGYNMKGYTGEVTVPWTSPDVNICQGIWSFTSF